MSWTPPKVRPRGRIKASPEDFVVDEIPLYDASGAGDHLYIHLRKRLRTTEEVVRDVSRALGVKPRDVGYAGLKDKVAVATQWISVPASHADPERDARARALAIDGVEILEVTRHNNKLRTGHLRANRFDLVVRDLPPGAAAEVTATLEEIGRRGAPNAFGTQRFGRDGRNADRARGWLSGSSQPPRDLRLKRLLFSAWQSAIFNAVLEARLTDGTWDVPQEGDVLKKEDSGGLFVCSDVQVDRERAKAGEVCPTGPIPGPKMTSPSGAVLELEERIAAPLVEGVDLSRAKGLGDGTRRPLRMRVEGLEVTPIGEHGDACRVRFVLPKGAYATEVVGLAVDLSIENSASSSESSGIQGDDPSDDERTEPR